MSEFRIDQVTNRSGEAGTSVSGITTFSGTSGMILPNGPSEYRGERGRGVFMQSPYWWSKMSIMDCKNLENMVKRKQQQVKI